jgi:hypothetical protein
LEAEFVQFVFEPWAKAEDVFDVALHGFAVGDGGFGGDECGEIYREWRGGAAEDGERSGVREDCAETESGEAGGFREGSGDE